MVWNPEGFFFGHVRWMQHCEKQNKGETNKSETHDMDNYEWGWKWPGSSRSSFFPFSPISSKEEGGRILVDYSWCGFGLSVANPSGGPPKAKHKKASQPHFPHFLRFWCPFSAFSALWHLLRPLRMWSERDLLPFPQLTRIRVRIADFEIRSPGCRMTGLR